MQATSSTADHLRKYIPYTLGTAALARKHNLLTRHRAHKITPATVSVASDDSVGEAFACSTPKRRRVEQSIIPKAKMKTIRELSVGFIIDSDVPFTVFKHGFLRRLFCLFDRDLVPQVPWSDSSLSREVQRLFGAKKDEVQAELLEALTLIHLSFDLWTSPHRLAIVAVFAHFIDHHGGQQSRLLALRRQVGVHSGENVATTLVGVVRDWQIEGRIGTVVADNVAANDTCLHHLYKQLDPSMGLGDVRACRMRCYEHILNLVARAFLFDKDAESFELESDVNSLRGLAEQDLRHWRTMGPVGKLHNLVKFITSSPQRSEGFRRIAQEHDIDCFSLCEESTAELEMISDNATRWNSTYLMIERALRKRTDIQAFIFALDEEPNRSKRIPAEDVLSFEDWRALEHVLEILKPIFLQTMRTQGWGKGDGHARLWEVLVGMEYLLEHFESWNSQYDEESEETIGASSTEPAPMSLAREATCKTTNECHSRPMRIRRLPARFEDDVTYASQLQSRVRLPEPSTERRPIIELRGGAMPPTEASTTSTLQNMHRAFIRASINNAWKKLDEYYTKLNDSPLLAAAIILHPRLGMSWLECTWSSKEQLAWVRDAKTGMKEYFSRWYHAQTGGNEEEGAVETAPRTLGQDDDCYSRWISSKTRNAYTSSGSIGEMERYLRLEPQDTQDPVQWWKDHRAAFPCLSSFALDIFAIPAMASDCERQFSLAELTLTSQRLSMSADTLERVQCLGNWVRHGGVQLGGWPTSGQP